MSATDQRLDELKGKYATVFSAIGQQGISLSHVHLLVNPPEMGVIPGADSLADGRMIRVKLSVCPVAASPSPGARRFCRRWR